MIKIIDPEMESIVAPDAAFEQIAAGMQFTEGPVWMPRERKLVYSDIPADRMYQWSPEDGLSIFREPSHHANGNILDNEGRLITCEHGSRRVTRTEPDGSVVVLAERYAGRRLNSPNDVVVKRDGTIWFTDPPYGIKPEEREQDGHYVFRLDPGATEPVIVADDFIMPNGLNFSPDEAFLYIDDSSRKRGNIRRFRVTEQNALEDDGVFTVIDPHGPDGMRVDSAGRIFSTAGDGVQVFRADGTMIGKFLTPETAANCCFGGAEEPALFITARTSVWRVPLRM
jgi:gluconolactonase